MPIVDDLEQLLERACAGAGETTEAVRRKAARFRSDDQEVAALLSLIESRAFRITDEQVAALRLRLSDDVLFELMVAASLSAGLSRMKRGLAVIKGAAR